MDGAGAPISEFSAAMANGNGLIVSPRLTFGLQGKCWGLNMRYWRMREPDVAQDLDLVYGTGSIAETLFKAETLDFEVTRLFDVGATEMQLAFGVRYGQLEQSSALTVFQNINNNDYSGLALASQSFHGPGMTVALTALRPIGCQYFHVFCNMRASILWDGNASNQAITRATYEDISSGWSKAYDTAVTSSEASLFIGEIQIGGQWNFPLKCLPATAFIRGAIEYQYWGTTDSGLAAAYSYAGQIGGPYGVASAHSSNAHISLVGFNVGTGLTW